MVDTPFILSEKSRQYAKRATQNIYQDKFRTAVGSKSDELTDIPGVGPSLARKLRGAGYSYIDDVKRASTQQLAEIDGVGPARADDLIDAAFQSTTPDIERLTDLDGVGPKISERLREAGISQPFELRGKSQQTIEAIGGVGPKRAARIRADVEFEAPAGATETGYEPKTEAGTKLFTEGRDVAVSDLKGVNENIGGGVPRAPNTISARGPERQDAIEQHSARTPESRRADESFNAPLMLDEDTWARNKNQYDYPGVDTIPRSKKIERVQKTTAAAKELGALSGLEAEYDDATEKDRARGQFSKITGIGIDTAYRKSEDTLAHELGHAFDSKLDRPSGRLSSGTEIEGMFDDDEIFGQAKELSSKRRGQELDTEYLESKNEVFADLFADAVVNPRRTKREAPDAFEALKEEVGMDDLF